MRCGDCGNWGGGVLTILERTEISARIQSGASRSPKHLNLCRSRRETPRHFAAAPRKRRFQGWLGCLPVAQVQSLLCSAVEPWTNQGTLSNQARPVKQANAASHSSSTQAAARARVERLKIQGLHHRERWYPDPAAALIPAAAAVSACPCLPSWDPTQQSQPTPSRVKKKRTTLKDCKVICLKNGSSQGQNPALTLLCVPNF